MNYLDNKINEHFSGLVVRKDLVKEVKGNAIVPNYVLEFLLGNYCATSDEASIRNGIETVKDILRTHFVHRNEANLIKSTIREKGRHRVIDKVTVELNEKRDAYEASFSNLGIKEVLIDIDTVKHNEKLLVGGVWCIADLAYEYTEDKRIVPWVLEHLEPIQMSHISFEEYLEHRKAFSLDEWMDLLMQSLGLNPEKFTRRGKMLQISRLIPFCERNFNLIELGPKGTGKSHVYSEFSPHGILISGGEVTVPKLFVNNSTGRIGLVGYWDCVAFDEFSGHKKKHEKALVDILKNYMANKSFSRGIETLGAEASMVFVGNTSNELDYMLMHTNLFEELPQQFYDSAFMDRLHYFLPGWEVEIIRGEMFSRGFGFVVDYLAEILRQQRDYDYSHHYANDFYLPTEISTRDRDGINKTFSGLLKILFPDGVASSEEMEEILVFAIEGRKRVKDQLVRIDSTFDFVKFGYEDMKSGFHPVQTVEEQQFPQHYFQRPRTEAETGGGSEVDTPDSSLVDDLEIIRKGETKFVEFKTSLRWNIHTNQPDAKIEKSSLKTIAAFMNSEGGTLYVGVQDNGNILGIQEDHFPSNDKFLLHFNNLFSEKIGKEFIKYIDPQIIEIEGYHVFKVACRRSDEPIFYKDLDRQDEFFVRHGPSSIPLSMREFMNYSKDHFKK
ncbi:MAG TPA: BREX system Lon protease-like protein BrxL [Anaerolineaceae bacterium]|nr:BREX system Lon protease-like protein BrxL [Anaerolineaceae bacterium]